MEVELVHRALSLARAYHALHDDQLGGVVVFVGRVRPDRVGGRTVAHLDYEADEPLARRELTEMAARTRKKVRRAKVVLWHRLGRIPVGEPSVIVGVAAPHRAEAFDAARRLIDELKTSVPIWKSVPARGERPPRRPRARSAAR